MNQLTVDATPLVQRIEAIEADVAKLREAVTAPVEPAAPDPVRPVDPTPAPDTIPAYDVNAMLDKGGRVVLPNADIIGTLFVTNPETQIIGDPDHFTRIKPAKHGHAVDVIARQIESLSLLNLHGISSHRDQGRGIRLRLSGNPDEYAKLVTTRNCRMDDFDTSYEYVDDQCRQFPEGTPGRIELEFINNIANRSYGDDSHSVGLYVEGLGEGCRVAGNVFDQSGWLIPADRNKRSHGIYAQRFGAPIGVCEGNLFSRSSANAAQFRPGCISFTNNIINQCSLGPWFNAVAADVYNNVILDQTDIYPPVDDPKGTRGHGFIFSHSSHDVEDNICARQNGSQERVPAFMGLWNSTVNNNVAADWHKGGLNFQLDGKMHSSIGTNRTVPGVRIPTFTDLAKWVERPANVPPPNAADFIARCWEAVK